MYFSIQVEFAARGKGSKGTCKARYPQDRYCTILATPYKVIIMDRAARPTRNAWISHPPSSIPGTRRVVEKAGA